MGEEVWTPEEISESQETRRAVRRGLEADQIVPWVTGQRKHDDKMDTVLHRKRASEVREI